MTVRNQIEALASAQDLQNLKDILRKSKIKNDFYDRLYNGKIAELLWFYQTKHGQYPKFDNKPDGGLDFFLNGKRFDVKSFKSHSSSLTLPGEFYKCRRENKLYDTTFPIYREVKLKDSVDGILLSGTFLGYLIADEIPFEILKWTKYEDRQNCYIAGSFFDRLKFYNDYELANILANQRFQYPLPYQNLV